MSSKNSSMKNSVEQHEYMDNGSPVRKQGRFKRHCARFWWLHLIIFVAISLVVILPVIFVGYPNIAQSDINKSKIIETTQLIRNPSATQLDLTLGSILETTSVFHPVLHAFTASLYLVNHTVPFATLDIPQLMGKNGTAFNVTQTVKIENMTEMTDYCIGLLAGKELNVTLKGSGGLKLGGLQTTTVNYDQLITLSGLNGLQGIEVEELRLNTDKNVTLPYGADAQGSVMVPNPSVNNVAFGNITMTMFVDDVRIGNATLPNFTLTPGNNTYDMFLTSNETALLGLLKEPKYQCGVMPVTMKGNESIYNGEVLPYFTTPLSLAPLSTTINLTDTLNAAGLGAVLKPTCET